VVAKVHVLNTEAIVKDFADWIDPVLVKELRQGLRTRIFAISFLCACVVLPLFFAFVAYYNELGESGQWREAVRYLFWGAASLLFLVLLPLNGLTALETELKTRALELLILTRMGSGAIVFGKWAALFCQALLLGVCLLPICLLGYFIGQYELVKELDILAALVSGSGVVSAGVIFLSRFPMWARVTTLAAGFLAAGPLAFFVLGVLIYYVPWVVPFFVPVVLMLIFLLTRELIAYPVEPLVRKIWLPASVAVLCPVLLAIPFFRSGLAGIVLVVFFAYLWMRSEQN
jgi:hypothetical protein